MYKVFRKELKYPISVLDFALLRKKLEPLVHSDSHSGDNGYQVRSLYFDSIDDQDLFDTLNGNMEKRKIRLRYYPPNTDVIHLEYKCKSGSDVIKHSIKLSKRDAERLMLGDYSMLLDFQESLAQQLLAQQIYARLMLGGYQPKVIVDYRRLAYTYPVSNTRITYDTEVSASYIIHSFFDENPGLVPITAPNTGVLEVKYNHFLVGILKEVLQSVDSLHSANSKYAYSRFLF
ncbi:MAG: polyphosphate polymerase domain-containing protein [Vulcanibacillus sp.]